MPKGSNVRSETGPGPGKLFGTAALGRALTRMQLDSKFPVCFFDLFRSCGGWYTEDVVAAG